MNILFLVHRYPLGNESILEKDLVKIFSLKGHKVFVAVPNEKSFKEGTNICKDGDITVLKVKTGNYFTTKSRIEKIISILTRPFLLKKTIIKNFKDEKFDYVIGYTPFMANDFLIRSLKKFYRAKSLLVLWDIFPQNAKDLKIIKNNFVFRFYKYKEKKMYDCFDKVICNCEGQIDYILENNLKNKEDLILSRNCEFLTEERFNKEELREKIGLKNQEIIVLFGGNMGVPQQLENIVFMAENLQCDKNIKFIFIGSGTEKEKLKKMILDKKISNIEIKDFVPRDEYENIIKTADIGIISLNRNYTVPNFPAKVTGYCKLGLPIFASLDQCSYKFLGNFIERNNLGVVTESGNIEQMKDDFLKMIKNLKNYKSENIQNVYKKEFDIEKAYNTIMKNIGEGNGK